MIELIRRTRVALLAIVITSCGHAQTPQPVAMMNESIWWTYLADYDGSPGSIFLDMSLKSSAPMSGYPKLIVTGVSYPSRSDSSGLPDVAQLDTLNTISDKRLALIEQKCNAVYVGSFTHKGERLDYIYVADPDGIEDALRNFYSTECPTRKPYINVKDDPRWQAYSDFLYPNARTIAFYRDELVKFGILD